MPPDTLFPAMTSYEEGALWMQFAALLITGIGIIAAFKQLKRMADAAVDSKRSNEISATAALIQVEVALFENLNKMDLACAAHSRLQARGSVHPKEAEAIQIELDAATQNYLNTMDRLCACILQGFYPEDRARAEYRHVLATIVEEHGSVAKDFPTAFPNITALRQRWNLPEGKSKSG